MKRGTAIALWVIGAPIGVLALLTIKTALDPAAQERIAARSACERMIEIYSRNPRTAEIGRVRPEPKGDLLVFRWTPDTLQLQNGFGAMLGQYASCSYNTKTSRVVDFSVD